VQVVLDKEVVGDADCPHAADDETALLQGLALDAREDALPEFEMAAGEGESAWIWCAGSFARLVLHEYMRVRTQRGTFAEDPLGSEER